MPKTNLNSQYRLWVRFPPFLARTHRAVKSDGKRVLKSTDIDASNVVWKLETDRQNDTMEPVRLLSVPVRCKHISSTPATAETDLTPDRRAETITLCTDTRRPYLNGCRVVKRRLRERNRCSPWGTTSAGLQTVSRATRRRRRFRPVTAFTAETVGWLTATTTGPACPHSCLYIIVGYNTATAAVTVVVHLSREVTAVAVVSTSLARETALH